MSDHNNYFLLHLCSIFLFITKNLIASLLIKTEINDQDFNKILILDESFHFFIHTFYLSVLEFNFYRVMKRRKKIEKGG